MAEPAVNEDAFKKLLEDFNKEQLYDKLSQLEVMEYKQLLPKIQEMSKAYEIAKWIVKVSVVGTPILLAVWQLISKH